MIVLLLIAIVLLPLPAFAQGVPVDTTGVRPGAVTVSATADAITVAWPDETSRMWRATFSLDPQQPLITSITAGGAAIVSEARPFYRGETGKRRGGWNAFFDDPTSHPDGTRHVHSTFTLRARDSAQSSAIASRSVFDGLRMGSFEGGLAYTFYPGSRLIQQEAVLTTNEPDVAYYYDAGLDMARPPIARPGNNMKSEIAYYDTSGALNETVAQRAAGRARTGAGPLSHAGRQDRRRQRRGVSRAASVFLPARLLLEPGISSGIAHGAAASRIGIRQLRDENWQYYPWVNAPPGRAQRMGVFFLLSTARPNRRSRTCCATRIAIASLRSPATKR